MNGKTSFAIDYLHMLFIMNGYAKDGTNFVSHATCRLFLIDWGLNPTESDEANKLFIEKMSSHTIDDFTITSKRVVTAFENREEDKKRFMHNLATIAALDDDLTDKEMSFYREWGELLDFKPTELETMWKFGWNWAIVLRFVGSAFYEQMKSLPQT
jgi:hypothetical protein